MAEAAIATGWPTLHVHAPDEATLDRALEIVVVVVGPAPQADTIEPSDDGDRWELRVDLPDLDRPTWERLREALDPFDAELRPGVTPGVREAIDLGVLLPEHVIGGGLVAEMWVDAEEGGVRRCERVRTRAAADDVDLTALAMDLLDAVRDVDPAIALQSDRGTDTVQPFVHPTSGRYGVEAFLSGTGWEDRPGDEVFRLREQVIAAIGRVVRDRAGAQLRIAPDLGWEAGFGMSVLLWLIGPATSGWPGDGDANDFGPPIDPTAPHLATFAEHVEFQVITPAPHEEIAAAVEAIARTSAVPIAGGRPRWLRHAGARACAPVWTAPVVSGIDRFAADLRALSEVHAVRAVPAAPYGFGDWAWSDPSWRAGTARWLLRVRDGRRDRDAFPRALPRDRTSRDELLDELLTTELSFARAPDCGVPTPVVDGAGREGLEIALPGWREADVAAILTAVGSVVVDDLAPFGTWGWRRGEGVAQLWWTHDPSHPPAWE